MSAWNSHAFAQRSQYASYEESDRTSGPAPPSGRSPVSTRKQVAAMSMTRRAVRVAPSPSLTNTTSMSLA